MGIIGRSAAMENAPMHRLDPRGTAAAAAAAVLYGTAYVATAFALRSFTPLGAAAARGLLGALLLGALLLTPWAAGYRPGALRRAAVARLAVLGLLGGPCFIVAMNAAVALSGATVAAIVAGLYAVLAAVFAVPLLGERLERGTLAALVLALAGTVLLSDLRASGELLGGIAAGLLAAIVFALFLVLSRAWSASHALPGPTVALSALGLTAVLVGGLIPLVGDAGMEAAPLPEAVAAVVWLAAGPGALAAVLVVTGMRRLPARRASAFLLLNPPTAALGAWLLLGERLSVAQLIGGALILAAMAGASGILPLRRDQAAA
jgi:drug/metabolite transporter (DMT)-like permease